MIFIKRLSSLFITSTLFFNVLNAQMTPSAMPPLQQKKASPATSAPRNVDSMINQKLRETPTLAPARSTYLHPGILIFKNGAWEGSDHLLNLPTSIGVYVTVTKPNTETLDSLTDTRVGEAVEKLFKNASINPTSLVATGQPALPAFEIEVLIYPIGKGFVAALDGRLFESVTLPRMNQLGVDLAFQAITWEKKSLIVGPIETINEQVLKAATDIAAAFIERYIGYQPLKSTP